jgi:hypothetical protein
MRCRRSPQNQRKCWPRNPGRAGPVSTFAGIALSPHYLGARLSNFESRIVVGVAGAADARRVMPHVVGVGRWS